MAAYTAFSYKQGNSIIHRCPAWIKILIIPLLNIVFFKLSPSFLIILLSLQTLVSLLLHFTVKEQLADLKAVIFYAVFLIIAKMAGGFIKQLTNDSLCIVGIKEISQALRNFIIVEKATWLLLMKLFCIMQGTAIIFKTSTSLQIREGLEAIEFFLKRPFYYFKRKKGYTLSSRAVIAETLSVFICFIPQVSKNWQQAQLAWKVRGGKKNLKMLYTLLPVFFSVGMKEAYNYARALSIRKKG